MTRRIVAGLLVLGLLISVPVAPVGAAQSSPYTHVWQAQSMYAGETGRTEQRVIESSLAFTESRGTYEGSVSYHDVIAISGDSDTVLSQEAVIELTLEGTALTTSGSEIGGTFTGTATLTERTVTSVEAALKPSSAGDVVTYDVTGHWGAKVAGAVAEGELIYETAVRSALDETSGDPGQMRPVAWFNRSSFENPDRLGEAQTLEARVSVDLGNDEAPGGEEIDVESESDAAGGNAVDSRSAPSLLLRVRRVLRYIRKGLSGTRNEPIGVAPFASIAAARALRDAHPSGATALPANSISIDIDMSGQYLDTKNRAAGLLGAKGPVFEGGYDLAEAAAEMRAGGPGIPALPPDVDAGRFWAGFALESLRSHDDLRGAKELIADLELVGPGLDPAGVLVLRTVAMSVLAVTRGPFGEGMLRGARSCAVLVSETELAGGALTDAVLAAARDQRAPADATTVTRFVRDESLDVARENPAPETLPGGMLGAWDGAGIDFTLDRRTINLDPERWIAYRRADGAVYWLPGEGSAVALTDGALLGWAYSSWRGALVDSDDVGVVSGYADAPARY